ELVAGQRQLALDAALEGTGGKGAEGDVQGHVGTAAAWGEGGGQRDPGRAGAVGIAPAEVLVIDQRGVTTVGAVRGVKGGRRSAESLGSREGNLNLVQREELSALMDVQDEVEVRLAVEGDEWHLVQWQGAVEGRTGAHVRVHGVEITGAC